MGGIFFYFIRKAFLKTVQWISTLYVYINLTFMRGYSIQYVNEQILLKIHRQNRQNLLYNDPMYACMIL